MGRKKTESLLFSLFAGESLRQSESNWLHGVRAAWPSFPAIAASETSGEPSFLAGNRCTMLSSDIIPTLSPRARVLLESDGGTYIVVLGTGVSWCGFGDGVSISERYRRMCIGVLPGFCSRLVKEGLGKVRSSSGGVRLKSSDFVSLSFNTFSKNKQTNKHEMNERQRISECYNLRTSIAPDHKSIFLSLEITSEFQRGPGLWKFNNTLLKDENYKELIEFYYPQILEKYSEVAEKQLRWELIKTELRSTTIKYAKKKRSDLRSKEESLERVLKELDHKICNDDTFNSQILEQYEAAKKDLKLIHEAKGKEAMFRSKMKWFEQGEKPTKYFFNLEKSNYEKKLIRQVKLDNEEIISNPTQVLKEVEDFYRIMYTSKINSDKQYHD